MDELSLEDLRFNPPEFPESVLHALLQREYNMAGPLKRLSGERDQNFRVTAATGKRYVLKISSPEEEESLIDFQIRALQHLEAVDEGLCVWNSRPRQRETGRAGKSQGKQRF